MAGRFIAYFFLRRGASVDAQRTFSNSGRPSPLIAHASLDRCASLLSGNSAFFPAGAKMDLPKWRPD